MTEHDRRQLRSGPAFEDRDVDELVQRGRVGDVDEPGAGTLAGADPEKLGRQRSVMKSNSGPGPPGAASSASVASMVGVVGDEEVRGVLPFGW
jgi:hypothetical protein